MYSSSQARVGEGADPVLVAHFSVEMRFCRLMMALGFFSTA